ncbi:MULTISPECIES: small acid-soluble spore protein Tlp [Bacillaceae]|uniref:Small, acid-soluble spore protein Tlp n=2 Tax=Bacillus infantis TaxID=324767 RepID=U5LC43_9BACI|nr:MULTISPECIES: small acid-soluble spore protein Tlp [Bacillus]OXT15931.1 small acid-soluble spore protein Tlp [Bacillus sp. OG2]HER2025619.1 small acid-soluble spore protein Tlp [Streptococcus pyogenes]AGX04251.1 spore protein [Bacillus infantis NRRL B-14911]EAR66095.1 small acid-soluble spore protein Tlp [Bacillus sp. NRRL B-14911]MCA1036873.1 small acid-soluble spore protein Tlp [Bacillus infantis]
MAHNRPNPDDRSDNVEKLQSMIVHTIENMQEAEASMEFANEEDKKRIEAKNERRRDSLDAFRSEVKDEYRAQQENGLE